MGVSSIRRSGGAVALLAVCLAVLPATGSPGGRDFGRTVPDVREISPEEAAEILGNFRQSRGGPDTILEAELIHFPRRGDRTERELWIRTGWENGRLMTRVDLRSGTEAPAERFLLKGGGDPEGWVWEDSSGEVVSLEDSAFLAPLVPGMEMTPFDLTAPYLDWPEAVYEGSERVSGSPAHWYRFTPPEDWRNRLAEAGIGSVRVAVDTRFSAPIRAEYLDEDGEVMRTVEARSFQKFSETWIVRRLETFDEESRDRTELRVNDALVELRLPVEVFTSEGLASGYDLDRES